LKDCKGLGDELRGEPTIETLLNNDIGDNLERGKGLMASNAAEIIMKLGDGLRKWRSEDNTKINCCNGRC